MVDEESKSRKRDRSKIRTEKLRSVSMKRKSKPRDTSAFKNATERKRAEKIS